MTRLQYLRGNFGSKFSNGLLSGLLVFDTLFVLIHIFVVYGRMGTSRNFMIDFDGGYPEFFQYVKYLCIVSLIAYLVFKKKNYSYLPWLGLFLLLGIDDTFGIHERFGWQVAHRLNLDSAMGLRGIDLGEIGYSLIAGTLFLAIFWRFYLKSSMRFKKTSWDISILFAFFLFFGIVVDMIHSYFEGIPVLGTILAIIEDGGEMIALSFLVWYFYFLVKHYSEERNFLYGVFYSEYKSDSKPKA